MKPFFFLMTSLVWPLALTASAHGEPMNTLTLYFYRSPVILNWSTPGTLTRTTLLSGTRDLLRGQENIALGHVTVKLECEDGTSLHTAMTQEDPMESVRLLTTGRIGLGILFHRFAGRLENRDEIERRLERNRRVRFLRLGISAPTCARLKRFAQEFESRGDSRFYGLPLRPRKGEGAGCSAFGMAFLELTGALEHSPLREASTCWSRSFHIPKGKIGTPDQGVPLPSLAFGSGQWPLKASEETVPLFFWEPNRMYDWVGTELLMGPGAPWLPLQEGRHHGLGLDLSSLPTPESPLFELPGSED